MKQKLLLICVCLFAALNGVKAWTSVTPQVGKSYYLHCTVYPNQFWYADKTNDRYCITSDLSVATPVYIESITDGTTYAMSFYVNGTKYYLHQHNEALDWPTSSSTMNVEGTTSGYCVRNDSYKGGWLNSKSGHRYMWPSASESVITWGKVLDEDASPDYCWQFIACEEAMTYMSTFCAGVAGANYVQSVKGWQRVTSISELQTNPEDYFFAIFSANAAGLMVQTDASTGHGYYLNGTNPLSNSAYLFNIENYSYNSEDYFVMKAGNTNAYYHAENNAAYDLVAKDQPLVDDDCRLVFEYADNAWNIKTWTSYSGDPNSGSYWGLWTPGEGYMNGKKMAGNKNDIEKGSFLIYRIAKKDLVMTDLIDNPDMETAGSGSGYGEHVKSWNNTGNVVNYRRLANSGVDNPDGAFTNTYCFENWTNASGGLTGQMSQTISSLPNGVYKLQLAALVRSVNGQFIYGKSNGKVYKTDLSGDGEKAYDYTVYVLVEDNQLEIGLDMNNAGADWAAIDNARLTYLISSLPASLTGVSGHMNASVAAAQTTAIAAYNAVDGQTPSNYAAAIEAIANAEASIAAYAKAATYLSSVEAVLATTNFYTPAAYASVYGTYKTAYDAGTLDDANADGLSYKVANYTGTERYDNNTANDLLIPGWKFGGNDASTSGSGFYINSWSTESDGSGDAADFANPFYEYWTDNNAVLSAKTISGTISGLTPNAPYSVTANVRVRQTDDQTKVAGSVTMQVGSGSTVDVTAGKQIGSTPRYIKSYTAVGNADSDGKLTLTFTVAGSSNISWLAFRDVNYTRLADDDDYTALNSAITTAEAKTLGFETGEYAPYNNIAALTALAAAQAINQEADNTQASVNNTTTTLSGATWTANAEDVECVYNGDFALADDGGWDRLAWTRSSNWGASIPDNYGSTDISTMQTAGASTGHAYYNQPGSMQYGNTGLYTMPLSANTIYQLSFKYASESENSNESVTASVLNSGDGMAAKVYGANTVAYKTADAFVTKTIKFVTGAAGNYVLTLANSGNTVITDVSITKAASQTLTFNEGGTTPAFAAGTYPTVALDRSFNTSNYSTLCLPFAMDADQTSAAFSEVYAFDAVEGSSLKFVTASSITAGTPYLVKAKSSTLTVNNVAVNPSTTTLDVEKTDGISTVTFKGVFSPIGALPTDGSCYIVSSNNLYNVNSSVGMDSYRAYFQAGVANVKSFVLNFDDTTVINAVEAAQTENSVIYNLAGQRLSKAQKGINIINGKKVLVK